ncbi:MAG: site-2 protease family protein [Patescibacteria group bacterium]|nr:site-2 protease family protein [Patescibacteria group bacterium]
MTQFFNDIIYIIIALLPAITVHEWAHAFAAYKLGDPTAKTMGRLTFNPLAHLDMLGTLALIFFHFGWGKPVPVNPANFRRPLRDQALVSLAGPVSNIIFAAILMILLKYLLAPNTIIFTILVLIAQINVILAVFNLLPFYPLDGSKILLFLFKNHQHKILRFYQMSPSILIALLIGDFLLRNITGFSIFGLIFGTLIDGVNMLIYTAT